MNVTKQLYQWDTGQKLTECTGIYVDYLIGDEVYRVEIIDGTCIIPDELLQTSGRYKVWECMADNTLREFAFKVLPRPVPPNYVFTPTEQLTFEGLVQKETNKFNTNAIEKLNAYNANADNRVAEFNAQTEQIQADVSELKSDLTKLDSRLSESITENFERIRVVSQPSPQLVDKTQFKLNTHPVTTVDANINDIVEENGYTMLDPIIFINDRKTLATNLPNNVVFLGYYKNGNNLLRTQYVTVSQFSTVNDHKEFTFNDIIVAVRVFGATGDINSMIVEPIITFADEWDSNASRYNPNGDVILNEDVIIPQLDSINDALDEVKVYTNKINLPKYIYAHKDIPIDIYFRNIMDYNPSDVYVGIDSNDKGNLLLDKWTYTPTENGTYPLSVSVYNHAYKSLNNNENFSIVVRSTSKTSLKCLVIGDSTVDHGYETQKMLNLANDDNYNLTLLGTRGSGVNQHEGRSGWTSEMFVNSASVGSVANAFYNPTLEKFDFSYYMNTQGYTNVDCVFIQLGINDIFIARSDAEFENLLIKYHSNIDYMINSIHAFDSNIKIVINTIIPCVNNQTEYGEHYGTKTVWEFCHHAYLANRKTLEKYQRGVPNIFVSWYCASVDVVNNMQGDVHPNVSGYNELGTQMYSFMRAIN